MLRLDLANRVKPVWAWNRLDSTCPLHKPVSTLTESKPSIRWKRTTRVMRGSIRPHVKRRVRFVHHSIPERPAYGLNRTALPPKPNRREIERVKPVIAMSELRRDVTTRLRKSGQTGLGFKPTCNGRVQFESTSRWVGLGRFDINRVIPPKQYTRNFLLVRQLRQSAR